MCGIAGIFSKKNDSLSSIASLFSANLSHRGPDGEGFYQKNTKKGSICLIHRRLAINDPEGGQQPLIKQKENGSVLALVVNGEIYNASSLKTELLQKDPSLTFKTHCDAAPLLGLYALYGVSFLEKLRGMYALALYDEAKNLLILARDPFGIKPLYYTHKEKEFVFSSEIKTLLPYFSKIPALISQKEEELLNIQFTTGAQTIFEDIFRLLPGEVLLIQEGQIKDRFFQKALSYDSPRFSYPLGKALSSFSSLIQETVDIHLLSDVPISLYYSGGVDSTILLKTLNDLGHTSMPAFRVIFEEEKISPLPPSLQADLRIISFSEKDFWDLLPYAAWALDDPVADYAVLPTLKLAQETQKQGIRVALSGEGGDEIFAGYSRYQKALRPWFLGGKKPRSKGTLESLFPAQFSYDWRQDLEKEEEALSGISTLSPLQKVQALDIRDWLPHDLLTKIDRSLMAFGVEGRPPFLDLSLAHFGFFLEDNLKIRKGHGKFLLKEWLERHVPLSHPFSKKKGFTVPVKVWLSRKASSLALMLMHQECLKKWISSEQIKDIFLSLSQDSKHTPRKTLACWNLLFYALWHKIHVERRPLLPVFDLLK